MGKPAILELEEKIKQLEESSSTPANEWQPNSSWWDIEKILEDDIQEGFEYKTIVLITDSNSSTVLSSAQAYKTSDGAYYTNNITHTWDILKDKKSNLGYFTRYIIYYYTSKTQLNFGTALPINLIYFIAKSINISSCSLSSKRMLQTFKFLDGTSIKTATSLVNTFYNNLCLISMNELNLESAPSYNNMFSDCYSLTNIEIVANISFNISFSSCPLNKNTIIKILNALKDLTRMSIQTLTLGITNLNKLTLEEKAIATNKNWTLA